MANLIRDHKPVIILGAGAFFIDRYNDNGGARGAEVYVGDTVAAAISATVERTTVYSGDGAVATKLVDKITQVDRTLSITPQDATLDNMALFLMAAKPAQVAEAAAADLVTVFRAPADLSDRHYFQLGPGPAGRPDFNFGDAPIALADGIKQRAVGSNNYAAVDFSGDRQGFEIDRRTGRIRFTSAKAIGALKGKEVEVTIKSNKAGKLPAFERLEVDSAVRQLRVALRYVEDADEGIEGRNLYIPQAVVAPAGEAALKSRDTAQQFPLSLSIEEPEGGLAAIYVDGVPAR